MDRNLIELSAKVLLEKFGSGNHKPGSGSAAALQGMLSAQLIRTVISLTTEAKRKPKYGTYFKEFLSIDSEIESRIYPELQDLFQADSDQFDKVITARQARDRETDQGRKPKLNRQALEELKPATKMPIEIAKLCEELADFAVIVFDHGFKAVRGDSGVAINGAVSAIGGCLSIIDLNLLSFARDEWTDSIRNETKRLRSRYLDLSSMTIARIEALKKEADWKNSFYLELDALLSTSWEESKLTFSDIEMIAKQLQNTMWKYQEIIWKGKSPKNPIDILKPKTALINLGYQFDQRHSLGQHEVQGGLFEIAGFIDKQNKMVAISEKFSPETRSFTAAHELGHALLHDQRILHRDRALDGSTISGPRDFQEIQADKFATYFLMPQKPVEGIFQELYQTEKFVINEETVFALNESSPTRFREKCGDLRGLSRILASTEYFNGNSFNSIAKIFGVSTEAMAIRLEELDLVEF